MNKKIFDPQSKIIANADRVVEFLETGNTAPVLVEFDPSNSCNHSCYFCLSGHIHLPESKGLPTFNRNMLSREIMLSVCKDLVDMGVRAVNWTGGGEPTANPALKECIEYLGSNNIKMGMFTNGTLLCKFDLIDTILNNMTWVRFSIDAGTRYTYNKIRRTTQGKNDWDVMLSNLDLLINQRYYLSEFSEKDNPNGKSPDIGVGFVITPDTYEEIIDFAEIFSELDVDYCQYKPEITVIEKGGEKERISFWENVKPMLEEAKKILGGKFQINEYKLDDLTEYPDTFGRNYKKCLGSQIQPCIGADGEVYVCPNHRGHKQYSYGSLKDKSFKEIWNDIEKRKAVMYQIEDVEKFSKCTALCKPHESAKKCWELYKEYENIKNNEMELLSWKENLLNIEQHDARKKLEHWQFI